MNYYLKIETEQYDTFGLRIKNFKQINIEEIDTSNSYFQDKNLNYKKDQDIFSLYNKLGWDTYFGDGNDVIEKDSLSFNKKAMEIIENNRVKFLNIFINKVNSNIQIIEMNKDNYYKFRFLIKMI